MVALWAGIVRRLSSRAACERINFCYFSYEVICVGHPGKLGTSPTPLLPIYTNPPNWGPWEGQEKLENLTANIPRLISEVA